MYISIFHIYEYNHSKSCSQTEHMSLLQTNLNIQTYHNWTHHNVDKPSDMIAYNRVRDT